MSRGDRAQALVGGTGLPAVGAGPGAPDAGLHLPGRSRQAPAGDGIVRPRLHARLDGVLETRLGCVLGPPGTGKTTLMAQWSRQVPVDVAWVRADQVDGRPDSLLRRLAATVGEASGGSAVDRLDGLLDLLGRRDAPLVLVLDDVHLVRDPVALDLVRQLLERLPPGVHVLVGSRRPLPFNLVRTEVPSVVVDAGDLRFRCTEVEELFATAYLTPLDPEDCRRLVRHTEGWAAALHLFHRQVASLSPHERHAAVLGLARQVRYAREYVGREILAPLPSEYVSLLRSTSVLEALSGRRCDLLLGANDAQRALLEMESRGVLAASTVGDGSFRLPTVVRSHLLTELRDAVGEEGMAARLAAAVRAVERDPGPAGPAEAVRIQATAGAWHRVVELMDLYGEEVLGAPDLDWVETAPRHVARAEPWLRLAEATRALRDGRLAAAAALAELPGDTPAPDGARRVSERVGRAARYWLDGNLEPAGGWTEWLRADLRRPGLGALQLDWSPEQSLLMAIGLALRGEVLAARERLDGCLLALHDPIAGLAGQLLGLLLRPGDVGAAEALADRAEGLGLTWVSRMARGVADAVGPGGVALLTRRLRDAENRGDPWGALLLDGLRCVVLLREGRAEVVDFDGLVARTHALDAPALEAWARAGLALTAAAGNIPDAVREVRSAEGYARSATVPGAVAVSYGALAVAAADDAAELLVLADSEADTLGLDWRPWLWVAGNEEVAPRPVLRATDAVAVRIRCFGGFELVLGDEAPSLTRVRPKARALLRMLAMNAGRPVHRELVVEALWPDLDPAAGTHNLQVGVSSLRALLEPGVRRGASRLLVRDGDRYTLRLPASSTCDVVDFEEAVAEAEAARAAGDAGTAVRWLEEGLRLYRGDLLPEDGPAEWVTGPRDHLRQRAAGAAGMLAELLLAGGSPDRAAAAALRGIDIDPCRDASWRLLLAAHRASGDMAAAERTRRSYAEVLASLGVVSDQVRAVRTVGRQR